MATGTFTLTESDANKAYGTPTYAAECGFAKAPCVYIEVTTASGTLKALDFTITHDFADRAA